MENTTNENKKTQEKENYPRSMITHEIERLRMSISNTETQIACWERCITVAMDRVAEERKLLQECLRSIELLDKLEASDC